MSWNRSFFWTTWSLTSEYFSGDSGSGTSLAFIVAFPLSTGIDLSGLWSDHSLAPSGKALSMTVLILNSFAVSPKILPWTGVLTPVPATLCLR